MEGDLLRISIDLLDLYRPGSPLTWRRLGVAVRSLPYESAYQTALRDEAEQALIPTADRIRDRQRYYDEKAKEAG